MAPRDASRVCPYCGAKVVLDECAIVSTAKPLGASVGATTDDGARFDSGLEPGVQESPVTEVRRLTPPSGAKVHGYCGIYPIIAPPTAVGRAGRLRRATSLLKPVAARGDARDLPRRACPRCSSPLPVAMDDHDAYILSVVGLNRAGKTYFLGATLYAATRNDALAAYGVTSITPLGDTAGRLHRDYARPLFKADHTLPVTPLHAHLERGPLTFKVSMRDGTTFVLVTHDVSGEALMSENDRAVTAGFVRRADALIFMADPLDMPVIAGRQTAAVVAEYGGADRTLNQSALLQVVLDELAPAARRAKPPLVLAVSKSDLISESFGRPFRFADQTNLDDWRNDCTEVHYEVRDLLHEVGEDSLIRIADQLDNSTFHAVSVLGPSRIRDSNGGRPAPVRVLDPLAVSLNRLSHAISAARGH